MMDSVEIGPVPAGRRESAMAFLAAGGGSGGLSAAASMYRRLIEAAAAGPVQLWWARRAGQSVAAALVVAGPGRAGTAWFTPPTAMGVDPRVLPAVLRAATRSAIDEGLAMVQALPEPAATEENRILRDAGYERLAELVYMGLSAPARRAGRGPGRLEWRHCGRVSDEWLGAVIEATYAGSLDCPALNGVRPVADIIAGHRATGAFCPESWWVVLREGRPAGCLLLNEVGQGLTAEVVYLGVVPEFRGQGFGRQMVRHGAAEAFRAGCRAIRLAVDSRNGYALSVYRREGFRAAGRRVAHVFTWRMRDRAGPQSPRMDAE